MGSGVCTACSGDERAGVNCSEMVFCCSCAVRYPFSLRSVEAVVLEIVLIVVMESCLSCLCASAIACAEERCLLREAGDHASIKHVWEGCSFG